MLSVVERGGAHAAAPAVRCQFCLSNQRESDPPVTGASVVDCGLPLIVSVIYFPLGICLFFFFYNACLFLHGEGAGRKATPTSD